MKYAVVKLENNGTSSYNLGAFNKQDEVIAFPLESLQVEMMRLKYYLEKAGEITMNARKSQVKYKKGEIKKAKIELKKASKTIDNITQFETQTSLKDFKWPDPEVKLRKRSYKNKNNIHALIGI